jgi:hypothetical protein
VKTKDLLLWGGLAAAAYYLYTQMGSTGSALPAAAQPLAPSGAYGPVTLPNGQVVTINNNQISMATGSMQANINNVPYNLMVQGDGSTLAVAV